MTDFNFVDFYNEAGLNPSGDIVKARQKAFKKLTNNNALEDFITLTRLYFQMPQDDVAWFKDAFSASDASFSMVNNERESSVLAACLLAHHVVLEQNPEAALCVLVSFTQSNRNIVVLPKLITLAEECFKKAAIKDFQAVRLSAPLPKTAEEGEDQNVLFSQWAKTLVNKVEAVVGKLQEQNARLNEENESLWWYIGGWSRITSTPFSELEPAATSVLAGYDLASLNSGATGPYSAEAILYRILQANDVDAKAKATIASAVDALDRDHLKEYVTSLPAAVPDICAITTALLKAEEIGKSPNWHEAFEKTSHLKPKKAEFTMQLLAKQVYMETLLLGLLQSN